MKPIVINIEIIESWNEAQFREKFDGDYEFLDVKGFHVYLVDLGDTYFKYAKLVFAPNGRQIRWVHDFELHHQNMTREEMRELYIRSANKALYSEEELAAPLSSYEDYKARRRFICELLPFCANGGYLSMFGVIGSDGKRLEFEFEKKMYPIVFPPGFCYFMAEDKDFADHLTELFMRLCQQEADTANNYDYMFSAFYYELGNHEYHINWQGDWDVLRCWGDITWRGEDANIEEYFDELEFTETQRKAYRDAVRQFLHDARKNDWY